MSKIYIYKNQYGYSTKLRDKNDKEVKYYLPVQFKRGNEPKDNITQIDILESFMSCYKSKSQDIRPKLIVLDYKTL